MSQLKRLYIFRSVPGAGKTTLAEHLKSVYEAAGNTVVIAEANDYFVTEGVYTFSAKQLDNAHAYCEQKVTAAMEEGCNVIFVTNTATRLWEFEQYQRLGKEFGYDVVVMVLENYHDGKSPHGLEDYQLANMRKRFDVTL